MPFIDILKLYVTNYKGGRFWEEGVDSGGVHSLPPGYTLESTPG